MNSTTQRLDSCLVWFGGVVGSLLLIFVISYIVDTIRLANAWNEAYTLAAQLGYTPERHLVDRVRTQPAHLLLGTAGCEVQVFFATPLNPSNFTSHLKQAISPLRDGSPTNGLNMYVKVPLIVNGGDAIGLYHTSKDELPPVYEHTWLAMDVDGSSKMVILYSELSKAKAEIEYRGHRATDFAVARHLSSNKRHHRKPNQAHSYFSR